MLTTAKANRPAEETVQNEILLTEGCSAARPPASATHQKLSILTFEPGGKSTLRRFTSAKNRRKIRLKRLTTSIRLTTLSDNIIL